MRDDPVIPIARGEWGATGRRIGEGRGLPTTLGFREERRGAALQGGPLLVNNEHATLGMLVSMDVRDLPAEWGIRLWPETFYLPPKSSKTVDYVIFPGGTPSQPTTGYDPGFVAHVPVVANVIYDDGSVTTLGGVTTQIRLTETTKLSMSVQDIGVGQVTLGGCLTETVSDAPVVDTTTLLVQFSGPGFATNEPASLNVNGRYAVSLNSVPSGNWDVQARYFGDDGYHSASSSILSLSIP